jgi:transposase
MELLSVIRRWHYRDHFSIREISRRTGLSRNTVRKYLRSDTVEPKFNIPDRPSKLDPYADKLSQMLRQEAGKSRKGVVKVTGFTDAQGDTPARNRRSTRQGRATPLMRPSVSACKPAG